MNKDKIGNDRNFINYSLRASEWTMGHIVIHDPSDPSANPHDPRPMTYELRLLPHLHTCADEGIIVTRNS